MSKENLCNNFEDDIETTLNAWITNRVIPYSNAYSSALTSYKSVIEQRNDDLERERELLLIVTSVVAVAALEFAPIAAAISAGSTAFRGQILLRVASVIGRNSIMSRTSAYRMLRNFTYGSLQSAITQIANGPGKTAIRSYLDNQMQETNTSSTGSNGTPQTELVHRNSLESTVRTSALQMQNLRQFLRDNDSVTESEARTVVRNAFSNNFFQKAPTNFTGNHPLANRSVVPPTMPNESALRINFEKSLFAAWCLGLVETRTQTEVAARSFPMVSPSASVSSGHRTRSYTNAGSAVLQRLQQLGVRINGQGVNTYVGLIETDSETRQIIRWGRNYLTTRRSQSL